MNGRTEKYFQSLVSAELLEHFRTTIGPSGEYLAIFDDLRRCSGDTQLHADNVGLTKRAYCDAFARLGPFCISELIRLAEIGLKAEKTQKQNQK